MCPPKHVWLAIILSCIKPCYWPNRCDQMSPLELLPHMGLFYDSCSSSSLSPAEWRGDVAAKLAGGHIGPRHRCLLWHHGQLPVLPGGGGGEQRRLHGEAQDRSIHTVPRPHQGLVKKQRSEIKLMRDFRRCACRSQPNCLWLWLNSGLLARRTSVFRLRNAGQQPWEDGRGSSVSLHSLHNVVGRWGCSFHDCSHEQCCVSRFVASTW